MQTIQATIRTTTDSVRRHPKRWALAAMVVLLAGLSVVSFWPRQLPFSYSGTSCLGQVAFLPRLQTPSNAPGYALTWKDTWSIGGYPVVARSLCATATAAPSGDPVTAHLSAFGWQGPIAKTITIVPEPLPDVSLAVFEAPIPAKRPLTLPLSRPDELFTYRLATATAATECLANKDTLTCEVDPLDLPEGGSQAITVERYFEGRPVATIAKKTVEVLPAAQVTVVSVEAGQTVYDTPREFTITLDKPLTSAKASLARSTAAEPEVVPSTVSVEGNVVTLRPTAELARDSDYTLYLREVSAEDGSGLVGSFERPFHLSGGPTVESITIGGNNVDPGAAVVLTFDQPLKDGQDIAKFVRVDGVPASVGQVSPNSVRLVLSGGRCQAFTVVVAKGLVSAHDIVSTTDWQYGSRTRCATSEVIGYSVAGRPIMAYSYGNGATTYLFTGAIHGNELSSTYTMKAWMNELEANPGKIPATARVVVVPAVSPDGVATSSRLNANGVNLNRNFPTHNWTSTIVTSSGEQAGGGGSQAGSEPETKALMALSGRLAPRLVVTHHSSGSLVNSNDVGVSIAAGQQYARLTGYSFVPNSATTGTFGFEMTGTYEDWLLERGTAAILVELNTNTGAHFAQNRSALWAMLGY